MKDLIIKLKVTFLVFQRVMEQPGHGPVLKATQGVTLTWALQVSGWQQSCPWGYTTSHPSSAPLTPSLCASLDSSKDLDPNQLD